jgi:Domain of unknown function (DUF4129)
VPSYLLSLCSVLSSAIVILAGAPAKQAQPLETTSVSGMPRSQLVADLDRLSVEIAALGRAADAPAIAARIPGVWHVFDGDDRVDVSARWLIAALMAAPARPDAWPGTRAALVRRLTGVRDEVAAVGDANGARSRAQARSAIESILARSEFQQSAASRWREQLQERVGTWFEDLWARFGRGRGTARGTALVFAWAAALAALVGVGFWLARTIADRPRGAVLGLGAAPAVRPRARELALRALSAARLGHTRDAVRAAYGAALERLEEQGVWRVDDARTPREYLPMLPVTDSRHSVMLDLTRRFEQIWYGNRAVAEDDARRVTDHLETLGCLRPGERAI